MYCPNCGKQLAERYRFCTRCGTQQPNTASIGTARYQAKETARALPREQSNIYKTQNPKKQSVHTSEPNLSKQENTSANSISYFKRAMKILWSVVLVILIIWQFSDPYRNVLGIKDMRAAYAHATEVVADYFTVPPSEMEFPKFDTELIQRSGQITFEDIEFNAYIISSYVAVPNVFGTMTRHEYTIKIGIPCDKSVENFYYEEPEFGNWYTPKS